MPYITNIANYNPYITSPNDSSISFRSPSMPIPTRSYTPSITDYVESFNTYPDYSPTQSQIDLLKEEEDMRKLKQATRKTEMEFERQKKIISEETWSLGSTTISRQSGPWMIPEQHLRDLSNLSPFLPAEMTKKCECPSKCRFELFDSRRICNDDYIITPRYSNLSGTDFEIARNLDRFLLYQQMVFHGLANVTDEYSTVLHPGPFVFLTEVYRRKPFDPEYKSFEDYIQDDNLVHYLTTHTARRFLRRQNVIYHFHQDMLNVVFPMGIYVNTKPRSDTLCGYHCYEFHQACDWHKDLNLQDLKSYRSAFIREFRPFLEDPCFWHSLILPLLNRNARLIGYEDEDEMKTQMHIDNYRAQSEPIPPQPLSRKEVEERLLNEPVEIRELISKNIKTLFDGLRGVTSAMPEWFKTHSRFIINFVCNLWHLCVAVSWKSVLVTLAGFANEIVAEFPNLVKAVVDNLIDCLKKVIRRFFPHAQAQSSREDDELVANESFIKTLMGLVGSFIPGFKVDSGILKARLERINASARILNSASTIWNWITGILEKIWTWIQIYWFGMTSEEIAERSIFLKSPDVQLWINDVRAFELSCIDGKYQAGLTTILTSKDQQQRVIDLKKRGEDIIAKLSLIDSPKISLVQLVKGYLQKVDTWFKVFEDTCGNAATKHEPFIIYLWGEPAVGKTFAVDYLNQFLCSAIGKDYDKDRDVYTKPRDSEYYEGYSGQFCCLLDDFLQIKNEAITSSELGFLIDAGSRARLHLNMADVSRKAATYFSSEVILMTSNRPLTPAGLESNLESFPALARRVDLMVEMRRDKNVKRDPSIPGFNPAGLLFSPMEYVPNPRLVNGGDWRPVSYPLPWREFCIATALMFRHKRKRQAELDNMTPVPTSMQEDLDQLWENYKAYKGPSTDIFKIFVRRNLIANNSVVWNIIDEHKVDGNIIKDVCGGIPTMKTPEGKRYLEVVTPPPVEEQEIKKQVRAMSPQPSTSDYHAQSENDDVWYDAEECWSAQAENDYCPYNNCPDFLPPNFDVREYLPINPPENGEIPTRLCYWSHIIERCRSGDQDHINLPKRYLFEYAKKYPVQYAAFPEGIRDGIVALQREYTDYNIQGFPISLSEAMLNFYDPDLLVAMVYNYRKWDYMSSWQKFLRLPKYVVSLVTSNVTAFLKRSFRFALEPVDKVKTLICEARDHLLNLQNIIALYAPIGLLAIGLIGVLAFTRMRSASKAEAACTSGDLQISSRKKNRKYVVESDSAEAEISGDIKVMAAKKKKLYRVEEEPLESAESQISGDLRVTSAKKKRIFKAEDDPEQFVVKYKADCFYNSTDPGVLFERVKSGEDVNIQRFRKTLKVTWKDKEPEFIRFESNFDINELLTQNVQNHKNEAQTEGEAQLPLVREMIGRLPPIAEGSCDNDAINAMWKVSNNIAILSCYNCGSRVRGLFLTGKVLMAPLHLIRDTKPEDVRLGVVTSEVSFDYALKDGAYYIDEEKDTLFIDVNRSILSQRPSIIKYFITDDDAFRNGSNGYLVIAHKGLDTSKLVAVWQQALNIEFKGTLEYTDFANGKVIVVLKGATYDCDTSDGWCGAPLLRFDASSPRKLIGMHVAGKTSSGFASIWTQQRLDKALSSFAKAQSDLIIADTLPSTQGFSQNIYREDKFELSGVMPLYNPVPKYVPAQPLHTKLRKSPLYGKIVEPRSAPSKKLPFISDEGIKLDPMRNALLKLDSPQVVLNQELLDLCAQKMLVHYKEKGFLKPVTTYGKMSLEINIKGDPDCQWIKKVNMKTSPGYPYVLAGGKHLFINQEQGTISEIVQEAIQEREARAQRCEETPMLLVDVMKDERLPLEKIAKGKIRLFNVCPLDFNLLIRKYFGTFMAAIMDQHLKGEVSVGINPHGDSWGLLYRRLRATGSHWIAGDYGAWDKRLPLQVAHALLPLVEEFYQQFDDYDVSDANVRRILFQQTFKSIRLARNGDESLIYFAHQSMPSGVAITAVFNSLINSLLFRYIFADLAIDNGWKRSRAINSYDSYVSFIAYGDDHILRVCDPVFDFFNMMTVSKRYAQYHIEYTSPSKNEVVEPEISDKDLTYLKRHFVERYGRIDGPMDLLMVLDITNWIHVENDLDVKEAAKCSIVSVLIELSHFSKEEYNEWYPKILKEALRVGLDVPIASYEDMVEMRREIENFDIDF